MDDLRVAVVGSGPAGIAVTLRKVLEHQRVRFLGNVELGADVTVADLHRYYDAIVVANGAAVDRRLGIAGEDLPGSFSATEFVSWYSGHPDTAMDKFALTAQTVLVIGVGNVAVDVARVLLKTAEELTTTDIPDQRRCHNLAQAVRTDRLVAADFRR